MCHNVSNWSDRLSTVLLGLRNHVRIDTGASPAEFLYGTTLTIPGEFVSNDNFSPDPQAFIEDFRVFMRECKPVPVAHKFKKRIFYFKDLATCTHVFLRNDAVRQPLERPYTGPHEIVQHVSDRVYVIDVKGKPISVTIERLKPAYFIPEDVTTRESTDRHLTEGQSDVSITSQELPSQLKTYLSAKKKVRFNLGSERP